VRDYIPHLFFKDPLFFQGYFCTTGIQKAVQVVFPGKFPEKLLAAGNAVSSSKRPITGAQNR
jgi:hypothetical protein